MVYSVPRKAAGLMLAAAGARVLAADCGLDSWECAPSYSAVPACATAAIESAALAAGCAHGDYKCECGKKEELQNLIFDEVVGNCGLLGGLDVVKAVSYLCDCDATASTFTACPTVAPSSTISEPPATPTECGLDSWECAPLYSSVPACATAAIESAALEAGCAHGDYKCECSKKEELQGLIFDEVVANCGLLGGLDVVKAVSYLCDCDATATTFEPCASATVVPSSTANSEPPITTNPPQDPPPSSTINPPQDPPSFSEPPVTTEPPTACGLDSWECAPLYSAVPVCATAIIESAALEVGCAHGDYKCECNKKEELQNLIFNDVVGSCGVLGGLDVVKAVSSLCDCDATAPTFTACPTGGAPSSAISLPSSVPAVPSSEPQPSAEPSTTDGCDDDEPTISSIVVVPSGQPSGEPSSQLPITITTTSSPAEPSGNPTEPCGEESWACAPEFAAVPVCAVDIISKAALQVGCAAGDHKCECSRTAEIQDLIFNDVVASCGVLGGLDVIKAVTALCECDAAKPTFKACDGNAGPSASVPVPGGGDSTTTITTTDIVTSDCFTSTSDVVVIPSSTVVPSGTDSVPAPAPSGPCGEESWECAAEFAAVPQCAVPIIEKAALDLGCASGDHKCECANAETIQGKIAVDVLGACGATKINDVLSSVEALCKCDAAKPTFTECGSNPGPTGGNGGGSGPGPTGGSSAGPITTTTSAPVLGGGSGGGSGPSGSGSSDCPAATSAPEGPCGIDSWACAEQFKAVPSCAVSIIEEAAISVGCAKGDHKCECTNQEKIQGIVFNDVLSACGVATGAKVISAVQALCECDSAKPTFTECGAAPAPTGDCNSGSPGGGNGGGSGSNPGPSFSVPGGGSGSSSSSFVTVTHSTTITTSAGPTGGNGGGSGSGPSGTGGSGDVPVPEPSDAIPPPPVVAGASKMMASTGCVALMAAVFAALL